jgi:cysteine dioxygenase
MHSSATGDYTDDFQILMRSLTEVLEFSHTRESKLIDLMANYQSVEREWQKYAFADTTREYTRNLVGKGNGIGNLVRQ